MNSLEPMNYVPDQDLYHPPPVINMSALESSITGDPLQSIADAIKSLTYGEMITLAKGIASHLPGNSLDTQAIANVLHQWSTTHGTPRAT